MQTFTRFDMRAPVRASRREQRKIAQNEIRPNQLQPCLARKSPSKCFTSGSVSELRFEVLVPIHAWMPSESRRVVSRFSNELSRLG